jgi:hypothetical protein
MNIIHSGLLRLAAEAVERYEAAERQMEAEWPEPMTGTVANWNRQRRSAEKAMRELVSEVVG